MTVQFPDSIRYKRRIHILCSEPLEPYFSEQRPKPEMFAETCTACHRGYLGIWAIRRGRLYLDRIVPWPWPIGVTSETADELCSHSMSALFPGATAPVFAEWYSGELSLRWGKQLRPPYGYYNWPFEHEQRLLVERGRIIGEKPREVEIDIPAFLRKDYLPDGKV